MQGPLDPNTTLGFVSHCTLVWLNVSDVFCPQSQLRAGLDWEGEGRSSPNTLNNLGMASTGQAQRAIREVGYLGEYHSFFPGLAVLNLLFYNPAKIRSCNHFWGWVFTGFFWFREMTISAKDTETNEGHFLFSFYISSKYTSGCNIEISLAQLLGSDKSVILHRWAV